MDKLLFSSLAHDKVRRHVGMICRRCIENKNKPETIVRDANSVRLPLCSLLIHFNSIFVLKRVLKINFVDSLD